jgi:Fic family protein
MGYYTIKKPKITNKVQREALQKWFDEKEKKADEIDNFVNKAQKPKYLTWDEFRFKEPAPAGLSREELWFLVKIFRSYNEENSPLQHFDGNYFKWIKLDQYEKLLHDIDLHTGGELFSFLPEEEKRNRQKFISKGIIEEAIASSQLEGASTSRKYAKMMIKEGRRPTNESEKMILNNYQTMLAIEESYKDEKMSFKLILELHNMITKDTKTEDGKPPSLRSDKDEIFVTERINGIIYHKSPPIDFVRKGLEKLVLFANDEYGEKFIHPLIKAIMIHFWIGYLHPFTDGNGRLARLLFYWYLLKNGYWAFAYLPISRAIKKSPIQYAMAYVYSEQDDYDMTYFIDYHLRKIVQAVEDFRKYLELLARKNYTMNQKARIKYNFNDRQIQLLQYLYGDDEKRTSIMIHINTFQITKKTAIKDLKELKDKAFLADSKEGKNIYYYPTDKIKELF